MSRRVAVAAGAGVAALAVVVLVLLGAGGTDLGPQARTGNVPRIASNVTTIPAAERQPLGRLAGETLDGERLDVADHRGSVVVVNFWGSWCGPCRREQEGLVLAAERLGDRGVRFVGVNVRDTRAGARTYVDEFSVPYPSLFDPSLQLTARLGAQAPPLGPPTTYVVDAQGRLAARVDGALPGGNPEQQAAALADVIGAVTGT